MAISFKNDESFLRKLAVGAAGTKATIAALRSMGFMPIELERGSTGFKIWKKIKIKRVRVPDILCLRTGLRVESRGKTKVEVSMSHSLNDPRRAWDYGMRDDDIVSIAVFSQDEKSPISLDLISPVHFLSIRDMRHAFENRQITITKPKGVEEGSEIRVMWPCAAAKQRAIISELSSTRLTLSPSSGGRRLSVQLSRSRGQISLFPQYKVGQEVEANQIIASVVPVSTFLALPPVVNEAYFIDRLGSVNLSERYAAAKALRYLGFEKAGGVLEGRLSDADEDIYVQLEAAAALAAFGFKPGWDFIFDKMRCSPLSVPLETQLETVIVLSEIPLPMSEEVLIEILKDTCRDDEIRAGAAWALGQFNTQNSAQALVDTFNLSAFEIKAEAARALLRIGDSQIPLLVKLLKGGDPINRPGISWALSRLGNFDPREIVAGSDNNLRQWSSYILGFGKEHFIDSDVEAICQADPEVYFAASVLWQILSSWVYELKEY